MESSYKKDEMPTNIKDLKKWKEERKTQKRKWREERMLKKLEKQKAYEVKKKKSEEEEEQEIKGSGRKYTVSIALPGSILDNAQSPELRTYLAGQIARAAVVFNVDEIIIFDETGTRSKSTEGSYEGVGKHGDGNVQLARILQYLECPQYLRKSFFPIHKDLQYAGLLNPLSCPHHMGSDDVSPYREGVVLNVPIKEGRGSLVDVGLRQRQCQIDRKLQPGVRVTVKMSQEETTSKKKAQGTVVAPDSPRTQAGLYWGYTVRLSQCLSQVFTQGPYKQGYDLMVGTSETGDSVDQFQLPKFEHLLVVFGGVNGLEASLDADEDLQVENPRHLFSHYLNTCPGQGSGTIRTEEAILISMSALRPKIQQLQEQS